MLGVALAVGVLLALAGPAAARPAQAHASPAAVDTRPVRSWSVLQIRGDTDVKIAGGRQRGGLLKKTIDVGPSAFLLQPGLGPDRAIASVRSTADGSDYHVLAQSPVKQPFDPHSPLGSVTHLDESQTYRKRSGDASLTVTISRILLDLIDQNGPLTATECPRGEFCQPLVSSIEFHARAYTRGAEVFSAGGWAFLQGSPDLFTAQAGTTQDSQDQAFGAAVVPDNGIVAVGTARSSSPGPPSPTASTRTSRSRATTPTAASTTTSAIMGSSLPV
ncbi:MAG TPA: hypothetical protein VFI54_02280 [Solirubrobacteraceae bacterium]|nr:hypothetical protein [Solirubrobacteraceae bacterium]